MKVQCLVGLCVVAAAAACTGDSSTSQATPSTSASGSAGAVSSFRPVAYARQLLDLVPTIPDERPLAHVSAGMTRPTQTASATNVVTTTRYWTSPNSLVATYRALKSAAVSGLRLDGYGIPRDSRPPQGELDFFATSRPRSIAEAGVFVEVRSRGAGGSVVGAFAQVVPYPVKALAERIPTTGVTATMTRVTFDNRRAITRRSVTLDDGTASILANAVDALRVVPPGAYHCPVFPPGRAYRYRIIMRGPGHVWTVDYPGACASQVDIARDRHRLPALESTPDFGAKIAASWRRTTD